MTKHNFHLSSHFRSTVLSSVPTSMSCGQNPGWRFPLSSWQIWTPPLCQSSQWSLSTWSWSTSSGSPTSSSIISKLSRYYSNNGGKDLKTACEKRKERKMSCCFILNPLSEYIVISDSSKLVTFGVLFLFIKHKWNQKKKWEPFSLFVAWQSQQQCFVAVCINGCSDTQEHIFAQNMNISLSRVNCTVYGHCLQPVKWYRAPLEENRYDISAPKWPCTINMS